MESGFKYIISKEGLLKLGVIIFSCLTFSLWAASGYYSSSSKREWILAAFIISFSFSFLFYFFRVVGLAVRMNCGGPLTYDGFDFIWAWFSTAWCFAASIAFAVNFPNSNEKWYPAYSEAVASIVFAYVTTALYSVESFMLKLYAPANIGYVATKLGWVQTGLVIFGASAFGLLVDSGYPWCQNTPSCYNAVTYALAAFCTAWTVTTLMWIAHMAAPKGSIQGSKFQLVEFVWCILSALLFFSGASCFAANTNCNGDDYNYNVNCQKRLSGVIFGFVTGVLYVVDAFFLRPTKSS